MRWLKRLVARGLFSRPLFEFFQKLGVHVVGNFSYNPIPDTGRLARKPGLWDSPSELVGLEMNVEGQLALLRSVFPLYAAECAFPDRETALPYDYHAANGRFGVLSASVLHCLIRHFVPQRIVEVGSGWSTLVAARACRMNQEQGKNSELIVVDPYPGLIIRQGFPGLARLFEQKVEDTALDFFSRLQDRDILFIDTNHVVKTGGDVNFLFLEVLPRLSPGVLVHVHDIFFPFDYPKEFVVERMNFYSEQYLLQAFLSYNRAFAVLWCESFMRWKHAAALEAAFPGVLARVEKNLCSSFWMRRRV